MELALFVYFAEIVGKVSFTLLTIAILLCFVILIICMSRDDRSHMNREPFVYPKALIAVTFCLAITAAMLPSKQGMYLIGGAYIGQQIASKVVESKTLEKVQTIIDQKLDSMIEKGGK